MFKTGELQTLREFEETLRPRWKQIIGPALVVASRRPSFALAGIVRLTFDVMRLDLVFGGG